MRKRRWFSALIFAIPAVLAVATVAVAGDGDRRNFKANTLTGYQEATATGPISTTGTGTFEATLNSAGTEITYRLTYGDLDRPTPSTVVTPTQAHIHFGQRGVSGGIIIWLCGSATNPGPTGTQACPPSPGVVTGTIAAAEVSGSPNQGIEPGSFAEAMRAIRAGMVYANVHTPRFGGGEIRGQINDRDQRGDDRDNDEDDDDD